MRLFRKSLLVTVLAGLILAPSRLEPLHPDVMLVDPAGNERSCAPSFASFVQPARDTAGIFSFLDDLSYAAAAGGPLVCAISIFLVGVVAMVRGFWSQGLRGGERRLVLVIVLGLPLSLALLYNSCFLPGQRIVLGPEAIDYVPASLHTQTYYSTGLLSPRDLVRWHWQRGFGVLAVTDKDNITAGLLARESAARMGLEPPLVVIPGEEYHGHPHLVFLNVRRTHLPTHEPMAEAVRAVHEGGGAVILAHPWSKRDRTPLDEVLRQGMDAVEIVNEMVHGGMQVIEAARRTSKSLVAVIDYKAGPNAQAMTLIPRALAATAEGVVRAIRERRTSSIYAKPGGSRTGAAYEADSFGIWSLRAALRALYETPRLRRATWVAWLAGVAVLWHLATRRRDRPATTGKWKVLFIVCCLAQGLVMSALSWQVREAIGPIPVPILLAIATVFAVPLLAASHKLACARA